MGWGVELFLNCIARLLALLKRRMNSFNHNTRQNVSGTIVAGQMKEPVLGFLGSRGGFPRGMALGGGVTVELTWTLSSGGLAVQVGAQCGQLP